MKNILIVTGHPDDEAMFFSPTILKLKHKKIFILCLSEGRESGDERAKELDKCCKLLGITMQWVGDFPDGFEYSWSSRSVAEKVLSFINKLNIDTLITFDNYGVSGHPNHTSCYRGVKDMILNGERWFGEDWLNHEVKCYKLNSVSVFEKYFMWLGGPFTEWWIRSGMSKGDLVFFNLNPNVAYNAMKQHRSQFVWFRRLYMMFSRFVYVNTLSVHRDLVLRGTKRKRKRI